LEIKTGEEVDRCLPTGEIVKEKRGRVIRLESMVNTSRKEKGPNFGEKGGVNQRRRPQAPRKSQLKREEKISKGGKRNDVP